MSNSNALALTEHGARFGADPAWLGKRITIGLMAYKVMGLCVADGRAFVTVERVEDLRHFRIPVYRAVEAFKLDALTKGATV